MEPCNKAIFANEESAIATAKQQKKRNGLELRPYHCTRCFQWHLTSQKPRNHGELQHYKDLAKLYKEKYESLLRAKKAADEALKERNAKIKELNKQVHGGR